MQSEEEKEEVKSIEEVEKVEEVKEDLSSIDKYSPEQMAEMIRTIYKSLDRKARRKYIGRGNTFSVELRKRFNQKNLEALNNK